MDFQIPGLTFLVIVYVAGAVVITAGAGILRSRIRVNGAASWILLALLGPLPALGAKTAVGLVALPTEYAMPAAALAILLSFFVIHWVLPAILPDFQTDSIAASLTLAVILGIVVLGAGLATGEFPGGLIGESSGDAFGGRGVELPDAPIDIK